MLVLIVGPTLHILCLVMLTSLVNESKGGLSSLNCDKATFMNLFHLNSDRAFHEEDLPRQVNTALYAMIQLVILLSFVFRSNFGFTFLMILLTISNLLASRCLKYLPFDLPITKTQHAMQEIQDVDEASEIETSGSDISQHAMQEIQDADEASELETSGLDISQHAMQETQNADEASEIETRSSRFRISIV